MAISYIAMLAYIAVALGYIPAGARPWAVLVTGRASLGLGGVLIVLAAVAGALGLCSLFGMWSTLIIMEVGASALPTVQGLSEMPVEHGPACWQQRQLGWNCASCTACCKCPQAWKQALLPPDILSNSSRLCMAACSLLL